jgi:hypothetical protein
MWGEDKGLVSSAQSVGTSVLVEVLSERQGGYAYDDRVGCWSSSVAAYARTYSFCSSGTTMDADAVLNSQCIGYLRHEYRL